MTPYSAYRVHIEDGQLRISFVEDIRSEEVQGKQLLISGNYPDALLYAQLFAQQSGMALHYTTLETLDEQDKS